MSNHCKCMELAYIIYIPVYILNAEETHVIEVPGITLGRLKKSLNAYVYKYFYRQQVYFKDLFIVPLSHIYLDYVLPLPNYFSSV